MLRPGRIAACAARIALGLLGAAARPAAAAETAYPVADGTLADGCLHGAFDGVADAWDFLFDGSGFENAITRTLRSPENHLEQRMVWEYDLRATSLEAPVAATLVFTLRGAAVMPFPPSTVQVYSYPADLLESPADFAAGPAVYQGAVTVLPGGEPAAYSLEVSPVVNAALAGGGRKVAFRFQIDPQAPQGVGQAFLDCRDQDPATKPRLVMVAVVTGDFDGDTDADLLDYRHLHDCFSGPHASPDPAIPGATPQACLDAFDFDADLDVDLLDLAAFQRVFAGGW